MKGRYLNFKHGAETEDLGELELKVSPEDNFYKMYSKDAVYTVDKWTATLVRGRKPVQTAKTFMSSKGDLSGFKTNAKPNDRIYLEIESLYRTNALGEKEILTIDYLEFGFNLPIN